MHLSAHVFLSSGRPWNVPPWNAPMHGHQAPLFMPRPGRLGRRPHNCGIHHQPLLISVGAQGLKDIWRPLRTMHFVV